MRASPDSPSPGPRPPPWAHAGHPSSAKEISALTAAFAAGGALAALDELARRPAVHAGAWRARLALKAAAAAGREEAELRDSHLFTPSGGDPGPAGRAYRAWRGLGCVETRPELEAIIAAHAKPSVATAAPLAAAAAAAAAFTLTNDSDRAFAAADRVLAARLGWRTPLPLLAVGGGRPDEGPTAVCAAYARAAASACALSGELAQAAQRLLIAAPKLRAKGAPAAIAALLEDDALSGAVSIAGLSERGRRRLFDRLVALGAIRELSGRATFRLYGL
jgi:hypothetical protein